MTNLGIQELSYVILFLNYKIIFLVALLVGGLDSDDAEIYSPNGGCSVSLPPIPEGNKNPHLAYINHEVFYCPSQDSLQCYIYDTETNVWNTYTTMPRIHNSSPSIFN